MAILQDLIVQGSTRLLNNAYVGYVHGGYMFGNISGNAETASRWQTPRTFTIGDQSLDVDGTGNVTFTISSMGIQPAITLVGSQNDNGYMVSLGNNQDVIIPKPTTTSTYGVIKTYQNAKNTATQLSLGKTNTVGKYYGVVTTTDGFAYVNVPWTDTDIHVTGIRYSDNQDGILTTINQNDHHFDCTDTIPPMTNTTFGVAKTAFKDTDIALEDLEPAAATRNRWYGVQKLAKGGNLIVNVPWTDTMISSISGTGASPKIGYEMTFSSGTNSKTISVTPASNTSYGVLKSAAAPSNSIASLSVQTVALPGKYYGVVMTTDGFAYVNVNHPWKADGIYAASLHDCEASGQYSVAEGNNTSANGDASHSEGISSEAWGDYSHAEGIHTLTMNEGEHAEGTYNVSHDGLTLHSIGIGTDDDERLNAIEVTNNGNMYLYGIGEYNGDSLDDAQSLQEYLDEFNETTAAALCDLSDRIDNINPDMPWVYGSGNGANNAARMKHGGSVATGQYSVAEGNNTTASGDYSHAEGFDTKASEETSHAEGTSTTASGESSHAEGDGTTASGINSHAEGFITKASGHDSHAEGNTTLAYGLGSHTEGAGMITSPPVVAMTGNSHEYTVSAANAAKLRIGYFLNYGISYARVTGISGTTISLDSTLGTLSSASVNVLLGTSVGQYSHAEGLYVTASGNYSHAEGSRTTTYGNASHAEGYNSYTVGAVSHAEGEFTQATNRAEHAEGRYNKSNKASNDFGDAGNTIHSVGIGTATNNRKNAFEIMQNGNAYLIGVGNYDGTNINGSTTYTLQKCVDLWEPGIGEHSIQQKYSGAQATGAYSIAAGKVTASGINSIAIGGSNTTAEGDYSAAFGYYANAQGFASFAEGRLTHAHHAFSHVEGYDNCSRGAYSHVEGLHNADGSFHGSIGAHIEGYGNDCETSATFSGTYFCHLEGKNNIITSTFWSNSKINNTAYSHIEGKNNIIYGGSYSHASGISTYVLLADGAHSEGVKTYVFGYASHSEGFGSSKNYNGSGVFNNEFTIQLAYTTYQIGNPIYDNDTHKYMLTIKSFFKNVKCDYCGYVNKTTDIEVGDIIMSPTGLDKPDNIEYKRIINIEPYDSTKNKITIEDNDWMWLYYTIKYYDTQSAANSAKATILATNHEDERKYFANTIYDGFSYGVASHSEGNMTRAIGNFSHSEGTYTKAFNEAEHAQGTYNKSHWADAPFGSANQTLFSVGCGTSQTDRKNAIEVMQNGDVYVKGVGNYDGTSIENVNTLQAVVNAGGGGGGGNAGNSKVFYGTCDTAADSAAKTVTCTDFTQSDLVNGVMIVVKFSNTNTEAVDSLTLEVNSTGAKPIKKIYNYAISNLSAKSELIANGVIPFVYTGSYWMVVGIDYNTNTDTLGYQLRTNSSVRKTTNTFRYYKILFTSADGTKWVPASANSTNSATSTKTVNQTPINPFGEIVYCESTTSFSANANVSATVIWQQYNLTLGYSFNRTGAALTLTTQTPVYIKCAPQSDGSAIIDATEPYVQTLPSTEDGKIYIFLGIATEATKVELTMNHPVYYYSNGKIRIWTGVETIESIPSSGYGQVKSIEVCQTPGDNPNTLYIVL